MKKKVDKNALIESCCMMNISKTVTNIEGNTLSSSFSDDKISLQNPLTPPQSVISSPINKIKSEREISPSVSDIGEDSSSHGKSPPISSLGPGAEIKGKICHPIPSGSKLDESECVEEGNGNNGTSGGRLAFYKEGKLLLELSHRSEQGSWVQVKSKTYWPPPSTTTSTTIQHPLRHDTPTTHSDDCSSVNSSPWSTTDHIRKQSGPNPKSKVFISPDHLFYIKNTPFTKSLRRRVRLRRNPYYIIRGPINSVKLEAENYIGKSSVTKDIKYVDRKKRLEKRIFNIGKKVDLRLDENLSIRSLFEFVENNNSNSSCESLDPNFVTPRKRYLRTLEADIVDSHIRKKVHSSNMSPASSHFKHCDRLSSSPLIHVPHKSAISSQNSSYSIDSLLSNEPSEKKNESFLRNLLKSDKSRLSHHVRHNTSKEHSFVIDGLSNHMKVERRGSPYLKERKEGTNDHKSLLPERFDLSSNLSRFTPHSNFGGLYLGPYLDPTYMMLHSLSSTTPFLPNVTQPNEMAVAVAAAAAAASYPLNPLHLPSLTPNNLLPGGIGSAYAPATSLAPQLLRSPTPNRSSPLSVPHSPSPKQSPALPNINLSPQVGISGSPREVWSLSPHQNSSPLKYPSTSSISPPPQEVPLNLTKPKRKRLPEL